MTVSQQASEQLIDRYQDLVRSIAVSVRRKAPKNIELEDLIAYGQVGLVQAARDFDPQRGNTFSTYAYYRIRGAIYDGLSKLSWTSRARYNRLRYQQMANEVACEHYADEAGTEEGFVGGRCCSLVGESVGEAGHRLFDDWGTALRAVLVGAG